MTGLEIAIAIFGTGLAIIVIAAFALALISRYGTRLVTPVCGGCDWQACIVPTCQTVYGVKNMHTGEWLRGEHGARWITNNIDRARGKARAINYGGEE